MQSPADMAYEPTTKVIVKNLPESWTSDFLINYLEVTTDERLLVSSDAIQVFPRVNHCALITLEKPITAEILRQLEALLARSPFQKTHILTLQGIPSQTCSLLVHSLDPHISADHILFYFDAGDQSGCGEGWVEDYEVYREQRIAFLRFSSVDALEGVIAKGNHRLMSEGEVLRVERWYEPFHRPLLHEVTACSRPLPHEVTACSRPLASHTPQHAVCTTTSDTIISAEALEMEKLRRENEWLKKILASKEAEDRKEERFQQQKLHAEDQEAEKQGKVMAKQRAEQLLIEKNIVKETVARLHQEQREVLQQEQSERERLKSENEKLKNQKSSSLNVPAYKFRLLDSCSEKCTSCNLTYLEQKEELIFYGMEDDCEIEKRRVLTCLQGLSDEVIALPEPVSLILGTPRGKTYLADLLHRHWGCSAEILGTSLLCVALSAEKLQAFVHNLKDNIVTMTCQVPVSLTQTPEFQVLKSKLETKYLIMLTCPGGDTEDVVLNGFKGDVELAASEMNQFTNLNRSGSKKFVVSGAVQGNACRSWFSAELSEVKLIILRNHGQIEAETEEGEYVLTFQCRQDVLADIIARLESIRAGIYSETIDLNKEFPNNDERALLINGLLDMKVRFFCLHLAEKLRMSDVISVGDIILPPRCPLPLFSLEREGEHHEGGDQTREQRHKHGHCHKKRSHQSGSRKRAPFSAYAGLVRHLMGKSDQPPSHSITTGQTTITVKLGDITSEQVAAAVCVLGPDRNPKSTAIGAAFLSKWPSLSLALALGTGDDADDDQSDDNDGDGRRHQCTVLSTLTPQKVLPMSVLFHAVLRKQQKPAKVTKIVREVVLQILQMAAEQGLTTIAFPPLGVGRRFGFGAYITATAIMSALQEFLQANPKPLTNITIVVYNDVKLAGTFSKVMKQTFSARRPRGTHMSPESVAVTSDSDGDSSDNSNNTGSDINQDEEGEETEPELETFEAEVCARSTEDCQTVREMLLEELSSTFLWHETVREDDVRVFQSLPTSVRQELVNSAAQRNVLLSLKCNRREIQLCGQKANVQEMLLLIQAKTQTGGAGPSDHQRARRRRLQLPEHTNRLPTYWRVCHGDQNVTFDKAIDCWKKRGMKFNSISVSEANAVEQLVVSTWELTKVGHGADAKNLKHSNIQVKKVQRLENPRLWLRYSQKREHLFTALMFHHRGLGPAACTSVNRLPKSSGPVRTSFNIPKGGVLDREIYQEVNEHYLFHGTKAETLMKICSEGMDDRMSGKAMLGRGVYLTESPTKADQYADNKGARVAPGQELNILLVRVLLGEPYLHSGNPEIFVRPPCFLCKMRAHNCQCPEPRCHDSVVFDSTKIFREFVVYDRDVCYPEYIITYVRV